MRRPLDCARAVRKCTTRRMRGFREQIEYIQRVDLIRAVDWLARVVVADGMGDVDDSFCP